LYVSTATGLNGSLILKIGSGSYTPPGGYTLAASGTDYAIWTKVTSPVAPLLMVSLSGGTFFTSQTITATASAGASIYYTTNNTVPNNTSTLYTGPIPINTTTTLRIIAYDPATQLYSREVNNTYIINSMPSSIKIRFKAPVGWTACKAYCWEGSTPLCGAWPGSAMTLENDGYYTYNVTGFANLPMGVVFNNGATTGIQQTVDLFTSEDKCWDAGPMSGGKYTALEAPCPTVGVGEKSNHQFRVFPNPTQGIVYCLSGEKIDRLTVTSIVGDPVPAIIERFDGGGSVDLSDYPSGVYYLEIVDIKGNRTVKPVVKY
jgi:alpha-amylase